MFVQSLQNRLLASYVASVGVAGHFARYVIDQAPDGRSFCVVGSEGIEGVAVSGLSVGLYEAAGYWIFAEREEIFLLLLQKVCDEDSLSLNFPLQYADIVATHSPTSTISVDALYRLQIEGAEFPHSTLPVSKLTPASLADVELPSEIANRIGSIEALPEGFPLYGIIIDGVLCAIADAAVRDSDIAAIQQVYTLPAERRKGYARSIVAKISEELLSSGFMPTYLVSESNLPSVALAESLGFILDSRWGYAE
ncbi:MAG: GNAT family N-acetyltransferase [Candidatus Kapaibacterium sp.]